MQTSARVIQPGEDRREIGLTVSLHDYDAVLVGRESVDLEPPIGVGVDAPVSQEVRGRADRSDLHHRLQVGRTLTRRRTERQVKGHDGSTREIVDDEMPARSPGQTEPLR